MLAGLGLLTGLVGISLALHQRDVKRVLAYSSIENMGLIGLALGVALWGRASGLPEVALLGTAAALLHVWNHALMKGLMFLTAGSVLHGTGTKDMEQLGGLMKRMPWTATAMMLGGVAICALPPLNGFAGKWLLYLSLMKCGLESGGTRALAALLSVGVLALIGGLAALSFVRLTGVVLLGSPRSEAAQHAHESSAWMLGPMLVLVLLCLAAAMVPHMMVALMRRTLENVLEPGAGSDLLPAEAPLATVGAVNAGMLIVFGAAALAVLALLRKRGRVQGPTWGCGYARPTARMQYTGRSFTEMAAKHLLPRFLRPRTARRHPQGLFPSESGFEAKSPDPISQTIYEPFFRHWAGRFSRLRILQQGKVHVYLVYILLTVVLALAWGTLRAWWSAS
jgi:NADH:ubiquinone oxidoreductase subunit 5 (subunit L)/multisubunit Na+/H+ antiporter MnhA subunit